MPDVADNTTRFSSRVADYVAHRPSYADGALTHLASRFPNLTSTSTPKTIIDIGSGTGILSQQLLTHFPNATVIGIEPNAEMRAAGDSLLASYINANRFRSLPGTAESTGLPDGSADLIVAAQAFHWFDVPRARAECLRILKQGNGAGVALIWNDRRGVSSAEEGDSSDGRKGTFLQLDRPIMDAYDLLLVRRADDYPKVSHQHNVGEEEMGRFFGPKGFETASFENPYKMDFEQLRGRLLSSSYTPQEGQEGYEGMMKDLKMLFEKYQKGGKVDFVYDTRVFSGVMSE